jgi:hypothetical protein
MGGITPCQLWFWWTRSKGATKAGESEAKAEEFLVKRAEKTGVFGWGWFLRGDNRD